MLMSIGPLILALTADGRAAHVAMACGSFAQRGDEQAAERTDCQIERETPGVSGNDVSRNRSQRGAIQDRLDRCRAD